MNLVPRLRELMRALLFGRRGIGHPGLSVHANFGPNFPIRHAPCGVWGAVLARARIRRAPHLWALPEAPAPMADAFALDLVRAYVVREDEQTRRPASPVRRAW
ncbi:hypothetical protein ACWD4G_04340 [Streptomyces sp. NPDC002643]